MEDAICVIIIAKPRSDVANASLSGNRTPPDTCGVRDNLNCIETHQNELIIVIGTHNELEIAFSLSILVDTNFISILSYNPLSAGTIALY